MHGLEGMPLRITATMAIIAVIVSVGFYELTVFLDFNQQKNFKEDIVDARQAFKTLQALGDEGSFSSLDLKVPSGFYITIDNTTDTVTGTLKSGENFTGNLTANLTYMQFPGCNSSYCTLPAGEYEIRIIYGEPDNPKDYSVYFR